MNKPNNQTNSIPLNLLTKSFLITFTLSLLFLTSACATASHKRYATLHVLDQENVLIKALETERQGIAVHSKVSADPALSEAETHLDQALHSLKSSNEMIKTAL